jgi:DNA-binding NtrC family response regulator
VSLYKSNRKKATSIFSKRFVSLTLVNKTSTNNNNKNHDNNPNSSSILIVDDEIDILSVIRQQLQKYGFNTCCFTKPGIALEHYKTSSNTHHMVISDLQMPTMNGFEFIRKVKEIDSNVKVFLTTCFEIGDLQVQNNSLSTKSIIDEFILKPFSIEKLLILINKHIYG